MKLYGPKGRLVSGIAALAGVVSALAAAAEISRLSDVVPDRYQPYLAALPIISLFVTTFAERVQGGASNPEVRAAAVVSERRNELEAINGE